MSDLHDTGLTPAQRLSVHLRLARLLETACGLDREGTYTMEPINPEMLARMRVLEPALVAEWEKAEESRRRPKPPDMMKLRRVGLVGSIHHHPDAAGAWFDLADVSCWPAAGQPGLAVVMGSSPGASGVVLQWSGKTRRVLDEGGGPPRSSEIELLGAAVWKLVPGDSVWLEIHDVP